MNLSVEVMEDLLNSTLKDLGRFKMTNLSSDMHKFEFVKRWMKKDRVTIENGTAIERNLVVDKQGTARMVGLFHTARVDVGNYLAKISIPWKHSEAAWGYDRRSMKMNKGGSAIVNLMENDRKLTYLRFYEMIESMAWDKPEDSDDLLPFYGLRYWIVMAATTGFTGGDPAGFSLGCAGLKVADQPRWANYNDVYTAVTREDLSEKMMIAALKTKFESPIQLSEYRRKGAPRVIYVPMTVYLAMKREVEKQNESLGWDLDPSNRQLTFQSIPVVWGEPLDTDVNEPVYMVNHEHFEFDVLADEFMLETGFKWRPDQPTMFANFVHSSFNLGCNNRREQAVLHKNVSI